MEMKSLIERLTSLEKQPLNEGTKPDFLDMDKDGNKKEPMKKAVADKKKPASSKVKKESIGRIAEALMKDMGYSDEQVDEWTLTSPSSWFNGRDYGDSTSRDDVRQQDALKNIQGGASSALVQNRPELAGGTNASEQGSDGVVYAVDDKGQRTHKLDASQQKWIKLDKPTPAENPELQPAVTDVPKPPPPPNPQPKPSANGVYPKDLARFQELINKFKATKVK